MQCAMLGDQCSALGQTALFDALLECIEAVPLTCSGMGTVTPGGCQGQAMTVEFACHLAQDGGVQVTDAGAGPG
jgi:hypothetical protein